ncbi:MAG: pyruvate kinase [Bacilli bacterium]|nr:pyruvate kinase [Bacilli bacterium]
MKKTKIICTIGPVSNNPDVMSEMAVNGMNVARLNFSHGNYEEKDQIIRNLEEVRKRTGKQVGLLFDTRGPEFRTGSFENDKVEFEEGKTVRIQKEKVKGNSERFSTNHPDALDRINVKDMILIENGNLKFQVIDKDSEGLTCKILIGGEIENHKSISVPNVYLDLPYISSQDKRDIEYACNNDCEFLAISFVNTVDNVLEIKQLLKNYDRTDLKIISKIESQLGVENVDEILDESAGIMIARGDLGNEIASEKLPIIQKQLIKRARDKGKIAIVATEMLESMMEENRPKRAETSDIANAVLDGTDAVMLSGETTLGMHPVETVAAMGKICEVTEEYSTFDYIDEELPLNNSVDAICQAVVNSSNRLGARLICASTISGETAQVISNLKPDAFILAMCPNDKICRRLSLNWGVYTKVIPFYNSTDEMLEENIKRSQKFMNLEKGDIIILTGSFPTTGESNPTNLMKIEEI